MDRIEPFAGLVDLCAVREVSTFRKAHPEEGIARLHHGHEGCLICLATGVRLNICKLAIVNLFETVDCDALDLVDIFAAAIIATSRITFGVFIRQNGTLSLDHSC